MAWRKWFVRGFVFIVVSCCAAAGYVYQHWTNPAAVREQVLAKLAILFPGANIAVDSAWLTLMGRIQLGEARLTRRDDPDQTDVIQVPSAYVYHDKEKMLEGELPLRKVELFRPRFRAYRNRDGKWNLQGLIGEQRLDRPIPTLVIHQGTLLLEDRTTDGNISSLEINDINLTLINNPLPTLVFDGNAQSPLVGKVTLAGTIERASGALELSLKTKDMPLGAKLLQRIGPFCPKDALRNLEIEGHADIDAKVHAHPGTDVQYDVACTVRKTSVRHPLLPAPLEDVEARARLVDGTLTVEHVQARSEWARIKAHGAAQFPEPKQNFDAHVEIDGLRITEDVIKCLHPNIQSEVRRFRPEGRIGVRAALAKREGEWVLREDGKEPAVTILPDKISTVFEKFPYPVQELSGALEYPLLSKKLAFHLVGKADRQNVVLHGHAQGNGADLDLDASIQAANVSINETLLKALSPEAERVARRFHAKGKVDVAARIRHYPGMPAHEFEKWFDLGFRDCDVVWESFPLPLTRVSGRLDLEPAGMKFHGFRGHHEGGLFLIKGESYAVAGTDKPGFAVQIEGWNVALAPALQRALDPMPELGKVWSAFAPSGTMNFTAYIDRPTEALADLNVQVQADGATIEPVFFKYPLTDVHCVAHFHKARLEIGEVSARHGKTTFTLPAEIPGWVDVKPGGGYRAEIPLLDVTDLRLDADFLKALPESLRAAGERAQLHDPVRVQAKLVVAQPADAGSRPEFYWDAKGWIANAKFVAGVPIDNVTGVVACRGAHDGGKITRLFGNVLLDEATLFKQPFKNIHVPFRIEEAAPEVLLADLHAPLFGGDVTGNVRVDFSSPVAFAINLTAAQIDLQKFGQHNLGAQAQMKGKGDGKLYLEGTSEGIKSLSGHGSFNAIAAQLYNLPLILDLLKFLGLRWPDSTAFEEVHALVRIRGPRVNLKKLDLRGNAISLSGQGEFNLDGTDLHVDFYPTWARIEQMSGPVLRTMALAVSKRFLIIEMRGNVTANTDDLKFNKRIVPGLVDPIVNARDRVIRPANEPRRNEPISLRWPGMKAAEPR